MQRPPLPKQIWYIIGNEGCERFSFYGMKNMLTLFMVTYLFSHLEQKSAEGTAGSNYHLFVSACYFFPLLGGALADRFWGKYKTILRLSLVYCAGHAFLSLHDLVWPSITEPGAPVNASVFYAGLALIALGSGGIKPCVSSFIGDQFNESNRERTKDVFALFYWIINFGSFFATLILPKVLDRAGPKLAFGIPGILMLVATVILVIGRDRYVHVPPTGKNAHSFLAILRTALSSKMPGPLFDRAKEKHPAEEVEGVKAALRVLVVFTPVPFFWALFDQKGSTWVVQARRMDLDVLGMHLSPSQLLALNPILVMLLVPLTSLVIFPWLERRGRKVTPLGKMTAGMFLAGFSFLLIAGIELVMTRGAKPSVLWQLGPYVIMTAAEVLVSATGLEFAYSHAPLSMKGTLMSFWNLTVTVGNLITALVTRINVFSGVMSYLFFAALIFLAAFAFRSVARGYRGSERFLASA